PASKSTTDESFGSSRFCCMAALTSAAGPRRKSPNPSATPSVSPNDLMVATNCATICASSKVTDCLNATDPATLTASPQRVFKSRCYFCSSTNACADPLPTARFHHRPDPQHCPNSRLEAAYHRADKAIQNIVDLLAAA